MTNDIVPVILSGGSGTRLWPLSRHSYPKQFLSFRDGMSLFQLTLSRLSGLTTVPPIVVSNEEHRFMVAEQMRAVGAQGRILLEPEGRNTAPAIAAAAFATIKAGFSGSLLVLPADHLIQSEEVFHQTVTDGLRLSKAGFLTTFGVIPERAETGYGYIRKGQPLSFENAFAVEAFVEKPDLETAQGYWQSGDYLWNSGMFLFEPQRYLDMLSTLAPEVYASVKGAMDKAVEDYDFIRLDPDAFCQSPSDSIDYAVMEKAGDSVAVVPMEAGWSDLGSWQALWESADLDDAGNYAHGDVMAIDCADSYIHADHRLVSAIGMKDVVIAETADAVLVAPRDRVQDVKQIVARLKHEDRREWRFHRIVYRPWGSFEGIAQGERFQVKRITVNPGAKLSLQRHFHRAEHWIVVRGTAQVTRGEDVFTLSENESTFIPLGVVHRLENPGRIPLEIIEVQSGSYLEEDDIIRIEDHYGR